MDKAGRELWDNWWTASEKVLAPVDPRLPGVKNYVNRRFHEYFRRVFSGMDTKGARLLEVGCARSAWLPYFAKEFGFEVSGIDYSKVGSDQERRILDAAGVRGEVVCADLFSPPEAMLGRFDVVTSFGVVEHFEDTAACLEAVSEFVKPSGIVITTVPNVSGVTGWLLKKLNKALFETHVVLDPESLAKAHASAGLEVLDRRYFLSLNSYICNLIGIRPGSIEWWIKAAVLKLLGAVSLLVWYVEDSVIRFKPMKATSPFIFCVARKPYSEADHDRPNAQAYPDVRAYAGVHVPSRPYEGVAD